MGSNFKLCEYLLVFLFMSCKFFGLCFPSSCHHRCNTVYGVFSENAFNRFLWELSDMLQILSDVYAFGSEWNSGYRPEVSLSARDA